MDLLIFLVQYIILQLKKETLLYKMERKTILLCIAGRKKQRKFHPGYKDYKDFWEQKLLHSVSSSARIEVQNKTILKQFLNFSFYQLVLPYVNRGRPHAESRRAAASITRLNVN